MRNKKCNVVKKIPWKRQSTDKATLRYVTLNMSRYVTLRNNESEWEHFSLWDEINDHEAASSRQI